MAFYKKKKNRRFKAKCELCEQNIEYVDYKDVEFISKYLSGIGQIKSAAQTSLCAKHQRKVAQAIKRARYVALIPYTKERIRVLSNPATKREPRKQE